MYQQFEGSLESIGTTLPMRGLGAKMGPKFSSKKIELSFVFHSICIDELVILVYSFSKLDKK